jgi:hypothetical protein
MSMKIKPYSRFKVLIVFCLLSLITLPVLAQSGGIYNLEWSTIDGGGGMLSAGGTYSVSGTAGQSDAGVMSGGEYSLAGGFWGGGAATTQLQLFLPVILR